MGTGTYLIFLITAVTRRRSKLGLEKQISDGSPTLILWHLQFEFLDLSEICKIFAILAVTEHR